MRSLKDIKIWGFSFILMLSVGSQSLWAQGGAIKGIQNTTKIATTPLKETQKTVKEATQPLKEVRSTTKAVTDAPKQVSREIKTTENSFKQAGNEVEKTKQDLEKVTGQNNNDPKAKQDSAAKAQAAKPADPNAANASGNAGVNYNDVNYRDKVGDSQGYGDRNAGAGDAQRSASGARGTSGSLSGLSGDGSPEASSEPNYDYRRVLIPPAKGRPMLKSATMKSSAPAGGVNSPASSGASAAAAAPPKPDYSSSPAREALESADFAIETLTDLFAYAEWDGPNRDHTMRSIDYTLRQLKRDIDEIRYKDPDRALWNYEKQYREWRDAYVSHGGQ